MPVLDSNTIINLTADAVVICIWGYMAFFKSYFSEKGKQLAVKEDIEIITNKVETIKSEFIRETEKIKAELGFLTQNKFSLVNEERLAILDFNEKYSLWLNTVSEISPADLSEEDVEQESRFVDLINKAKLNYHIAASKADLFINDREFINIQKELAISTLKFQHNTIVCLAKTKYVIKDKILTRKFEITFED